MSETTQTRVCSWCGATVEKEAWCQSCIDAMPNRPAPETMTAEERIAEFNGMARCEIPFPMIHKRIEELMGRPVWTHEMVNSERLREEMRWEGRPATMEEIIDLIPAEKRIVIT